MIVSNTHTHTHTQGTGTQGKAQGHKALQTHVCTRHRHRNTRHRDARHMNTRHREAMHMNMRHTQTRHMDTRRTNIGDCITHTQQCSSEVTDVHRLISRGTGKEERLISFHQVEILFASQIQLCIQVHEYHANGTFVIDLIP